MMFTRLAVLTLVSVVMFNTVARAITPATLVGEDLQAQAVNLQGAREGQLLYFGEDRVLRTEPLDRFLQIRDLPGAETVSPGPDSSTIVLSDGQRFAGQWLGVSSDGRTIQWRHPLLGDLTLALDRVRTISFRSPLEPGPGVAPAADLVQLVNGDRLEGFVTDLTADGVAFAPDGAAAGDPPVLLPFDRLAVIRLANPDAPPTKSAHHLVLNDGSRLAGENLTIAGKTVAMTLTVPRSDGAAASVDIPLAFVSRIDLASPRGRLADLGEATMTVTGGGTVFGVAMPPAMSDVGLRLHAPVTLRLNLPPGSARFAAQAVLDLQAGADARRWADLDLIVRDSRRVLLRQRLHAGEPTAVINIPLTEPELIIELDPGLNGPVMDRLLLLKPTLFIQTAP